jgi:hypothetical protein
VRKEIAPRRLEFAVCQDGYPSTGKSQPGLAASSLSSMCIVLTKDPATVASMSAYGQVKWQDLLISRPVAQLFACGRVATCGVRALRNTKATAGFIDRCSLHRERCVSVERQGPLRRAV